MKSILAIGIGTVMLAVGADASADSTFAHGYEFLPVRDAGNAPYGYWHPDTNEYIELYGGVNHEYRISSTPTTATQWAAFLTDFATAFGSAPVAGTSLNQLRGSLTVPGGSGFVPFPGYEQQPINTPWRGAAIYCNWLHHGKTSDPEKLLVGAYDATTFGNDGPFTPTDQYTTLPGAKFWIPTRDEYAKAAYYDPNRHGEGQGGYWMYPDASDTPLIPGLPEEGGETNGFSWGFDDYRLPVGSYPDVQSAYGMLDVSGGVSEWTSSEDINRWLYFKRSNGGTDYSMTIIFDQLQEQFRGSTLPSGWSGFRIVTHIPSPASIVALGFLPAAICVRRHRIFKRSF
ncbi:MAG: SUMF1/EgtB/PvdO family nonheme iron enzyme [Phycisphaerales bacterium]